jgi:hypothetical protein
MKSMPKSLALSVIALALLVAASSEARADLVVNGGFETIGGPADQPPWNDPSGNGNFSSDPANPAATDWMRTDGQINISPLMPHSGTYDAAMGTVGGPGFLTQTLSGTVSGQLYNFSFYVANDAPADPANLVFNSFTAFWDFSGLNLATAYTTSNADAFDYIHVTGTFTASGPTTDITFSAQNDAGFWHVDDVSVTPAQNAVPEPSTWALAGLGCFGLLALRRRRAG